MLRVVHRSALQSVHNVSAVQGFGSVLSEQCFTQFVCAAFVKSVCLFHLIRVHADVYMHVVLSLEALWSPNPTFCLPSELSSHNACQIEVSPAAAGRRRRKQ